MSSVSIPIPATGALYLRPAPTVEASAHPHPCTPPATARGAQGGPDPAPNACPNGPIACIPTSRLPIRRPRPLTPPRHRPTPDRAPSAPSAPAAPRSAPTPHAGHAEYAPRPPCARSAARDGRRVRQIVTWLSDRTEAPDIPDRLSQQQQITNNNK